MPPLARSFFDLYDSGKTTEALRLLHKWVKNGIIDFDEFEAFIDYIKSDRYGQGHNEATAGR